MSSAQILSEIISDELLHSGAKKIAGEIWFLGLLSFLRTNTTQKELK